MHFDVLPTLITIPAAPDILNSQVGRDNTIYTHHFDVI